uniref:Uncharacterized protein n=1 Tax=Arundo donax TaxID=35708 RepID=A0A0A8YY60_ARUDO
MLALFRAHGFILNLMIPMVKSKTAALSSSLSPLSGQDMQNTYTATLT